MVISPIKVADATDCDDFLKRYSITTKTQQNLSWQKTRHKHFSIIFFPDEVSKKRQAKIFKDYYESIDKCETDNFFENFLKSSSMTSMLPKLTAFMFLSEELNHYIIDIKIGNPFYLHNFASSHLMSVSSSQKND